MKYLNTSALVAFFNLFVKMLESRAQHVEQKAAAKAAKADQLIRERLAHMEESARASNIAKKINELVS